MSNLSEEEIIKQVDFVIKWISKIGLIKEREYIKGLLDLYNKEKEKNKKIQEYANWHIEHLTEDIADYIDDDRKGNANIIGEFKEEREHWKDIIRLMKNEKTYIDYENY